MALTPKQEVFCRNIVAGMPGVQAYLSAYDGKSNRAAQVESVKLMQRNDITEKIKELRKPIENLAQNEAISARQTQIDYIKNRIHLCEQKDDEQSIIRYTIELNKIYGLYKETDQQTKQNELENINIEALKKLSDLS